MQGRKEAGSAAVVYWRYAPMGPDLIPSHGILCAFGYQSMLALVGFPSPVGTLLHLELVFLNKSVSAWCFMKGSLK